MKWIILFGTLLAFTPITNALTPDQISAIQKTLAHTPAPELSAVAAKLIKTTPVPEKAEVRSIILDWVTKTKPGALRAVSASLPTGIEENRPTDTAGNDHGNRPIIPPGTENYGKPHKYGRP